MHNSVHVALTWKLLAQSEQFECANCLFQSCCISLFGKNNITPVTLENDLTISCFKQCSPKSVLQQASGSNHEQKAETALCLTDQIVGICCCLSQAPDHAGFAATLPHHWTAAIGSVSPALLKGLELFVSFSGLQRIVAKHPAWLF